MNDHCIKIHGLLQQCYDLLICDASDEERLKSNGIPPDFLDDVISLIESKKRKIVGIAMPNLDIDLKTFVFWEMGWETANNNQLNVPEIISAEIATEWFDGFEAYLAEYAPEDEADLEGFSPLIALIWDERKLHTDDNGKPILERVLSALKRKMIDKKFF